MIPRYGDYNDKRTEMLFTENGKLFLYNIRKASKKELIDLGERIIDPQFMADDSKISFILNDNAFIYDLDKGSITKLTNINKGTKREEKEEKLPDFHPVSIHFYLKVFLLFPLVLFLYLYWLIW